VVTEVTEVTEATEEQAPARALPRWYDPSRPLVCFDGGPRDRSWEYADSWAELRRLAEGEESGRTLPYEETRETRAHRLHGAVHGRVWRWTSGATAARSSRDSNDADPTWLDKL
jgi:hypothetical protein